MAPYWLKCGNLDTPKSDRDQVSQHLQNKHTEGAGNGNLNNGWQVAYNNILSEWSPWGVHVDEKEVQHQDENGMEGQIEPVVHRWRFVTFLADRVSVIGNMPTSRTFSTAVKIHVIISCWSSFRFKVPLTQSSATHSDQFVHNKDLDKAWVDYF